MSDRIGFFEVSPGARSMGRLLAFLAKVTDTNDLLREHIRESAK